MSIVAPVAKKSLKLRLSPRDARDVAAKSSFMKKENAGPAKSARSARRAVAPPVVGAPTKTCTAAAPS